MSLEDRDWYREAMAEREGRAKTPGLEARGEVDFRKLFEQEEQRRRALAQGPQSKRWFAVLGALLFVGLLTGLGGWVLRLYRALG